ncbi:hypothetical protein ACOSP7_013980 [Xanthoceras sorbifolium]
MFWPKILFFHSGTKHMEIDIHFIREKVASTTTGLQVAGVLTKGLAKDRFQYLCTKLTLVDSPQLRLRRSVKVTVANTAKSSTTTEVEAEQHYCCSGFLELHEQRS